MRKPAFCIFCGLCILTSFSLLTINVRGVSNKHCLLPFFIMPGSSLQRVFDALRLFHYILHSFVALEGKIKSMLKGKI